LFFSRAHGTYVGNDVSVLINNLTKYCQKRIEIELKVSELKKRYSAKNNSRIPRKIGQSLIACCDLGQFATASVSLPDP